MAIMLVVMSSAGAIALQVTDIKEGKPLHQFFFYSVAPASRLCRNGFWPGCLYWCAMNERAPCEKVGILRAQNGCSRGACLRLASLLTLRSSARQPGSSLFSARWGT